MFSFRGWGKEYLNALALSRTIVRLDHVEATPTSIESASFEEKSVNLHSNGLGDEQPRSYIDGACEDGLT